MALTTVLRTNVLHCDVPPAFQYQSVPVQVIDWKYSQTFWYQLNEVHLENGR